MEETIELHGHEISVEEIEQAIENFVEEHGTSGPYQNVSEYADSIIIVADSFPDEDVIVLDSRHGEVFSDRFTRLKEMVSDAKEDDLIEKAREVFGHYRGAEFEQGGEIVETTLPTAYRLHSEHISDMETVGLKLFEVKPTEKNKLRVFMEKDVDASE